MRPRTPALPAAVLLCLAVTAVAVPVAADHGSEPGGADGTNRTVNVTVAGTPGGLPPEEAVDAATPNRTVRADEWLVLTADVGAVLAVNGSTTLDARAGGTAGVTLRAERTNPCVQCPGRPLPLANLTRFVDPANGTVTYLYSGARPGLRGDEPAYDLTLAVDPSNAHVDEPVSVTRPVTVHNPGAYVDTGFRRGSTQLLPNASDVTLEVRGGFAPGRLLSVVVEGNRTLAAAPVNRSGGTATATVDLAGIDTGPGSTRAASLRLRDGHSGRALFERKVLIGRLPGMEVTDVTPLSDTLPRNGTTRLRVTAVNRGTAAYTGPVAVRLDASAGSADWRDSREVTVPAGGRATTTLTVRTRDHPPGRADLTVSAGEDIAIPSPPVDPPYIFETELLTVGGGEWTVPPASDSARIGVELANPGERDRETTVRATLADRTVERTVVVPGERDAETSLELPTEGLDGRYTLRLRAGNDTVTERIEIVAEASDQATATRTAANGSEGTVGTTRTSTPGSRTTGVDSPGFGVVVTLGVLLALGLLGRR